MGRRIEKLPPQIESGNKELREISDYLSYLREQINFSLELLERKISGNTDGGGDN